MELSSSWKTKPNEGKKFIYRYFDDEGRSYIGQTKNSLFIRAGGVDGRNYTVYDSKFSMAILEKGFDNFEYEILEEVDAELADEREKFYIRKFDTRKNGYNSTHGGRCYYGEYSMNGSKCTKDLSSYSKEQISNLAHNLAIYFSIKNLEKMSDEEIINKTISSSSISYTAWVYHKGPYIECNPIVFLFNFDEIIIANKYNSRDEMYLEIMTRECLGGDLLTCGCYSALEIVKLDKTKEIFEL